MEPEQPVWWCTCNSRTGWRHTRACLERRDQQIMGRYLGSLDSLEETARRFGITRERVRQIFIEHGRSAQERPRRAEQMLNLLRQGKSPEEVATEFRVTVNTVRTATRRLSRSR